MGLSFSDIFDDDIPYEQKPPQMLTPMEETDFPIQAKDLFAGLWESDTDSQVHFQNIFKSDSDDILRKISEELEESDELHFDVGNYDHESSQAFCVFIVYPEFSVWFKRKNGKSEFFSDNHKLQEKLKYYNGFKRSAHHQIRLVLQLISDHPDATGIIPKREYKSDTTISNIEEATGRMWGIQGKLYISFWQDRGDVRPHWSRVEKVIRASGQDPKKASYLFGGVTTEDGLNTYEEVTKGLNLKPSDPTAELRQKLHTSPNLKKAILNLPPNRVQNYADRMGIPVAQLKSLTSIDEAQDDIPPEYGVNPQKRVSFNEADSIFIIDGGLITAMQEQPDKMVFFSNDHRVERLLNTPKNQEFLPYGEPRDFQLTHTHLARLIDSIIKQSKYPMTHEPNKYGDIAGRVWKFHGETSESAVVGFWQGIEIVRAKWNQVKEVIEKLGVDWRTAEFTFNDIIYKKFSHTDITGIQPNPEYNEKELEVKRQLHTSPQLKKAVLKLPTDKLQSYADMVGIPVIKLKQLAGSSD